MSKNPVLPQKEKRIMRHSAIATSLFGSLLLGHCLAQSGAVIPQGGAGHASQASCIILKRMGPADEVTSHLYSFGIRGKQFQYVEGKLPEGVPFHGRLTDHDVRELQGRGAEVLMLESHYTADDLKQARDQCRGETGQAPNQAEPKPASFQATSATTGTAAPAASGTATAPSGPVTDVSLSSTPAGADINIDGNFAGQTPSTLSLTAGDHTISIEMPGFKSWGRTIHTAGGKINLNATLVKAAAGQLPSTVDTQSDSLGDAARAARAQHAAAQSSDPQN